MPFARTGTKAAEADKTGHILVKGITGKAIQIPYKDTLTIHNLKRQVMNKMKIVIEKQRLIYDGNVLKVTIPSTVCPRKSGYERNYVSISHKIFLVH